jgi:hypothetical protein
LQRRCCERVGRTEEEGNYEVSGDRRQGGPKDEG